MIKCFWIILFIIQSKFKKKIIFKKKQILLFIYRNVESKLILNFGD